MGNRCSWAYNPQKWSIYITGNGAHLVPSVGNGKMLPEVDEYQMA